MVFIENFHMRNFTWTILKNSSYDSLMKTEHCSIWASHLHVLGSIWYPTGAGEHARQGSSILTHMIPECRYCSWLLHPSVVPSLLWSLNIYLLNSMWWGFVRNWGQLALPCSVPRWNNLPLFKLSQCPFILAGVCVRTCAHTCTRTHTCAHTRAHTVKSGHSVGTVGELLGRGMMDTTY